jgi:hypothetical protein
VWADGHLSCAGVRVCLATALAQTRKALHPSNGLDPGATHSMRDQQSGKATVGDQDEVAFGEPTAGLQGHLPAPVEERLVATTPLLAGAHGGRQRRQDRQGPDAPGPGMGASSIRLIQSRPLGLTKCASEERT